MWKPRSSEGLALPRVPHNANCIVVGVAGVDDQRQLRFQRGFDMRCENLLLFGGR